MAGRFAPSPTGDLHIGNLRTALVSALLAHTTGREFIIRMEDLDLVTASPEFEERQIADLAAVGVVASAEIVRQSERFELYRNAIDRLTESGDAYPCYCSRREIRAEIEAAAQAPNGNLPDGAYPGTCRNLTTVQRSEREAHGVIARRARAKAKICTLQRLGVAFLSLIDFHDHFPSSLVHLLALFELLASNSSSESPLEHQGSCSVAP